MKIKYVVAASALFAVFFVVSCAIRAPRAEDPLDKGPLAKILVYVGDVPLGSSGADPVGLTIDEGGIAYLSAQGRDANFKPIAINPSWTATSSEILSIEPKTGPIVALKGLRKGTVEIVVESSGVKRTLNLITVR
ncbi:MAG: hypothetical protein A2231_03530 [Candidatus Firestonebacteria bacterium RIFOXYA2_FULL_40_8]|nr:MAG: hypothetical protein A2231_03530 [Candidatus Firestonebacteria bacterium RIFOXYA2_FULL_40_8]